MIATGPNRQGKIVKILSRKTNQLMVTETRAPRTFRALPRQVGLHIAALDVSKKFLVRYQDLMKKYVTAVRCWKCGREICAYQPVLREVEGKEKHVGAVTVMTHVNGQKMVLGSMLPFNHYREGLFEYRTKEHRLARFSYLHCADCHIGNEHGEDVLACLLGQFDHRRDHLKPYLPVMSDDEWAQHMFHWSGIELVGTVGPSLSPTDMMQEKKG